MGLACARHGHLLLGWVALPHRRSERDPLPQTGDDASLIALAITVAFLASWGASLGILHHELNFWWELAALVVIMPCWATGSRCAPSPRPPQRWIPWPRRRLDEAEKVDGDDVVKVSPADLAVGDVVIVRPGSSVPADGKIVDGSASMDESMVTGESKTVRRESGDQVVAGTVATDSGLRVEVTATGEDTALAGIQKLVSDAQASSSRARRIADTAAAWLFWFALGAGLITAAVWSLVGLPDTAVVRTITVLVIACPHALGLAIPLVVSIATERAARGGVLIKDRLALESMRTVDAVLFDKTGTLTKGEPTVTAIDPAGDRTEDEVLALAAAAEADSEHPLARAIVGAARTRELDVPAASDFSSSPAVGVKATVDGTVIEVGGPYLLEQHGAGELPVADTWREEGAIILHVLADGEVIGALRLADEIRPESREAVDAPHAAGVQVVMITGDAQAVADTVAKDLGIDRVFAGVRPEDKAAKVAELQDEGPQGRHGRRRRQRRARTRPSRRGHRHRRGHRRGDRLGRRHPRLLRPALGALRHRTLPGDVPEDEAKPVVGRRLQPHLRPAGRRHPRPDRVRPTDEYRRDPHVRLYCRRRPQRPAATPTRPHPASQHHQNPRPFRMTMHRPNRTR